MAAPAFAAGFPAAPMVDTQSGEITPVWRGFLLALFNRTGGGAGSSSAAVAAALTAETASRVAADETLTNAEAAEAAARQAAIEAEVSTRAASDAALAARIATLASTIGAGGGATILPLVDGPVALVGSAGQLARADHVHPLPPQIMTYIYTQATPAAVWTINHGLGKFPSVDVVDSTNAEVEGDVAWPTNNRVVLTFAGAFSGVAYLN